MTSLTVATEPKNRWRKKLGVGEEVDLTVHPAPASEPVWALSGGGLLSNTTGLTTHFTAAERAGAPTITATVDGISLPPVRFDVVEPTEEVGFMTRTLAYKRGIAGAGMCLRVELLPNDVSFGNLETREVPGPATQITGYFSRFPVDELKHTPSGWLPLSPINATNDRAELALNLPPPWSKGSFEWDISVQWNVKGTDRADAVALPKNVVQTFSMNGPRGKVTVTKLGQRISRRSRSTSGTLNQEDSCPPQTIGQHSAP